MLLICVLAGADFLSVSAAHARGLADVRAEGRRLSESFATGTLSIRTVARDPVRFEVFLAVDEAQRVRGLMFVDALPDEIGMLFVYDGEQVRTMWMKNTRLPLDMLFIDSSGRIVDIVRGTTPYSLTIVSSKRPALAVLELKSGTAARYGIRVGDRVTHELFDAH